MGVGVSGAPDRATGPEYTTSVALVTVTVCAPSATTTWYGSGVRLTSVTCTQPVLPFRRTGSSTSTQPLGSRDLTRNTCGTLVLGSLAS